MVSIWNPHTRKPELYRLRSVAFGQGAAVYGFNRIARAIEALFAELLIPTGN